MPTLDATRVLSTPKVMLNGRLVKINPNSLSVADGGDAKVRFVSSGGGSGEIVMGFNAEEQKASIKFSIAHTAENVDLMRDLLQRRINGIGSTIRIGELTHQDAYDQMFLVNKPERKFEAEGSIEFEFEGKTVL